MNLDAELFLVLFDKLDHGLWAVVDGEDNVGDSNLDESLDLVENHGFVGKLDEGLGDRQGQRPEPGSVAFPTMDETLIPIYGSNDVPPTRIKAFIFDAIFQFVSRFLLRFLPFGNALL